MIYTNATKRITTTAIKICFIAAILGSFEVCGQIQPPNISLDGLVLSKSRYDSLKVERAAIVKIRAKNPTDATLELGSRGISGLIQIITLKGFVVISNSGVVQYAESVNEKSKLLSGIDEGSIRKLVNFGHSDLLSQFGKENVEGGIIVWLR